MPVPNATYLCDLTTATAVPGHPVFGANSARVGVIMEIRPHPWGVLQLECRVRWAGGSERWIRADELHDYDTYLSIVEAELIGLYNARVDLERRFAIPVRPVMIGRP